MLISRDSIFYCSTFPAHPGFPSLRENPPLAPSLRSHECTWPDMRLGGMPVAAVGGQGFMPALFCCLMLAAGGRQPCLAT